MRKSLFWLLLAATAATPAGAQAPSVPGGGDQVQIAQRGERGGWRGPRGGGETRGSRGGFERGPRGDAIRVQRPARGVDGASRGGTWQARQRETQARDGAGFGRRPDRGQWRGDRTGDAERGNPGWRREGRETRTDGWRGERGGRPERGDWNRRTDAAAPGVAPGRDWNRDGRRWNRERDRNGNRDWNSDRTWDGSRDWNRGRDWNSNRTWNGNRGWDRGRDWTRDNRGWNDRGWDRGRGWNRDWRRDTRYDWQRYRFANRGLFSPGRYYAPRGWGGGYRRFGIGLTIGAPLFASSYWINDPWSFRLPPVDGPYRWVRYYDDVLLIDIRNGYVVDVIHEFFW